MRRVRKVAARITVARKACDSRKFRHGHEARARKDREKRPGSDGMMELEKLGEVES